MTITEHDIHLAYQLMLARTASDAEVASMRKHVDTAEDLRRIFHGSAEYRQLLGSVSARQDWKHDPLDVLFHYYCEFDAVGTIKTHAKDGLKPEPGYAVNFLGLKVPPKIHPPRLNELAGIVEGPPNHSTWHADIAEWAAALRSVDLAQDTYRIVELGCGWGCWISNMGLAARERGLKVDLIGVGGDAGHLANAEEVLNLNGFNKDQYRLFHGVAAARRGKAIFPLAATGVTDWNQKATFYPDSSALTAAQKDDRLQVLDCLTLEDMAKGATIDLLHIDIQGAETEYVRGNQPELDRLVRRTLIGTHSRIIEGELMEHFQKAGWRMEMERPAIAPLRGGRPVIGIDGVQLWANPRLT